MENIEYKIEETGFGTWRRYAYPNGSRFAEYRSHKIIYGLPLVHYAYGICPETGKRIIAKGIIAIGRIALGGIAIGQTSLGLIAIGQLGLGILFGLAQAATGFAAVGQVAIGIKFGLGQLATGAVAIGQLAIGKYVLAQLGFGEHVWSQKYADPGAVDFFKSLKDTIFTWFQQS